MFSELDIYRPERFRLRDRHGIGKVATGCPNLSNLDIFGCWMVSNNWLEKLAAGCPNLSCLVLHGNCAVTDVGFQALASGYPTLASIGLTGCEKVIDAGRALFDPFVPA
jgi:F-box/leucine-rich repeat protein 2/20